MTITSQWIATGLAFPSLQHRLTLRKLGIPEWAIRLDLLGIMLPDNTTTVRVNGKWFCRTERTISTPMDCDSEADAKACKLIHLIETGQMTMDNATGRLEAVLTA